MSLCRAPPCWNRAAHRIGQPLEGRGIALDLVPETPLGPFGGELDRSERILDLVRDAPRDVRPGGAALIEQLLGDILETEHKTVALRDRLGGEGRGFGVLAHELDDRLMLLAFAKMDKLRRDLKSEEHTSELQSLMHN